MKNKASVPDYETWSRSDSWKFKDAALLLQNIEPFDYSSIKFNVSLQHIPAELHPAYKIYFIFQSSYWDYHFTNPSVRNEAHPFDIIAQAQKKDIAIPRELKAVMDKRIQKALKDKRMQNVIKGKEELLQALLTENPNLNEENEELTTRERRNFYKTIRVLVKLIINLKNSPLLQCGKKPNAFQVKQLIIEEAQNQGMDITGLKSIDRKISEAWKILEEEGEEEEIS